MMQDYVHPHGKSNLVLLDRYSYRTVDKNENVCCVLKLIDIRNQLYSHFAHLEPENVRYYACVDKVFLESTNKEYKK